MIASKYGEEGGDGPPSWVGVLMGVVYGGVSECVGRLLVKIFTSRLGWGVE